MPPLPLAQDQIIALESEVLDDCIALRSLPNDEAGVVCSHAFDAASNLSTAVASRGPITRNRSFHKLGFPKPIRSISFNTESTELVNLRMISSPVCWATSEKPRVASGCVTFDLDSVPHSHGAERRTR